jgi:hypothetical protein
VPDSSIIDDLRLLNVPRGAYIDFADYSPSSDLLPASAALQAAMTAAMTAALPLRVRAGRYYLPSLVNIAAPLGLTLIGDDSDRSIFYTDQNSYMLSIGGGVFSNTGTLLTAAAAPGDMQIAVASSASFTAGGWANLQSNKIWSATSGKNARYGEMVRIKSISGNVLLLYSPLDYGYDVADAPQVNACGLASGINISGIRFQQTSLGTTTGGALVVARALAPRVRDIKGDTLDGPLLSLNAVVRARVGGIAGREMSDDEANGRYGYVVNLNGPSRDCIFDDLSGYSVRHVFTTNSSPNGANAAGATQPNGVPVHNQVSNSSGTASTNAVFSVHEEGDDTQFSGCRAYASMDMGFECRGLRTRIKNCSADGLLGPGFFVQATAAGSVLTDVSVSQLTGAMSARGNQTAGVVLLCPETVLDGFDIRSTGNSSVLVGTNADRQRIRNGHMDGFGKVSNPAAIRFNGASVDHAIENVFAESRGIAGGMALYASAAGTVTGLSVRGLRTRSIASGSVAVNVSGISLLQESGPATPQYVASTANTAV